MYGSSWLDGSCPLMATEAGISTDSETIKLMINHYNNTVRNAQFYPRNMYGESEFIIAGNRDEINIYTNIHILTIDLLRCSESEPSTIYIDPIIFVFFLHIHNS